MECKYIVCPNCREEYACYSHNEIIFCETCILQKTCRKIEPSNDAENFLVGSWCNKCLNKSLEELEAEKQ